MGDDVLFEVTDSGKSHSAGIFEARSFRFCWEITSHAGCSLWSGFDGEDMVVIAD
jgi:hypothetical protein